MREMRDVGMACFRYIDRYGDEHAKGEDGVRKSEIRGLLINSYSNIGL